MSATLQASYDDFPYESRPRFPTHPDCLATVATLFGMRPAPPDRCRALELGCSTGGNLLALADALPGSRFVGIDLSPVQIQEAQRVARAVGLTNVELKAVSILDVDDSLGTFDYIIAEGVYSWVPDAVRAKILGICRRNLAPQGVAYVSYNTYPGWHQRGLVREMMRYHARPEARPAEQVAQARAFLQFLVGAVSEHELTYRRMLHEEAELLRGQPEAYIYHEHLEPENRPLYFHQFAEQAAAAGLQYFEEAWEHSNFTGLSAEAQATLRRWAPDRIRLEQYLDFLTHRTFRRSLLCHAGVALRSGGAPDLVPGLLVSALARPTAATPDVRGTAAEEFRTDRGRVVNTNIPLIKAALLLLYEAWPTALSFDALSSGIRQRLGPGTAADARQLAETLLRLYLSNSVALHVSFPQVVAEPGERPLASPLARHQAATAGRVSTRLHNFIELDGLERAVLCHLDGTRDRAALVEALAGDIAGGRFQMRQDGQPVREPAQVRAILSQALGPSLRRLALSALLIG
jgi:methyltransferase-like protein/cyclopropane fatty-acyl-phospholipid synthase-like methyltransferase